MSPSDTYSRPFSLSFADVQTQGMQIGERPASHHITNRNALNTLQNTVLPKPEKGARRNAANSRNFAHPVSAG
jgi:hypothetical protein